MAPRAKNSNSIVVGCCNFATKWGNKEANLRKIKSFSKQAAEMHCDVVLFPEMALTGYECESERGCSSKGLHKRHAESLPGPSSEAIGKVAADYGIYIIFGLPELASPGGDKVYDSAAVVGPDGLLGVYRKLNLLPTPGYTEQLCFSSGADVVETIPVFRTRFGPIGVAICYDFLWFPEIVRTEVLKGAHIVFNPSASPCAQDGQAQPHMHFFTATRAAENMIYTASANLVGKERSKTFYGGSMIAGPAFPKTLHIYAEAGREEALIKAELSLDELCRFRARLKFPEDRKKFSSAVIKRDFNEIY